MFVNEVSHEAVVLEIADLNWKVGFFLWNHFKVALFNGGHALDGGAVHGEAFFEEFFGAFAGFFHTHQLAVDVKEVVGNDGGVTFGHF